MTEFMPRFCHKTKRKIWFNLDGAGTKPKGETLMSQTHFFLCRKIGISIL